LLKVYEEAGTIAHETLAKSFEKYGISNALDVTEGDVLFEENGFSSESDISDDSKGFVTSRGLILHCPFVK